MKRAVAAIKGPKGRVWDVFIGLEVHAQIQLHSKLFSRSQANTSSDHDLPNSRVSLFDASCPGTLPVLNGSAVNQAMRTALALGCNVHRRSVFERKHYFYSDLPHGYQITQHRRPIATGGSLPFLYEPNPTADAGTNKDITPVVCDNSKDNDFERLPSVGITRIQLEMDSGKSLHDTESGMNSLVDLNRAGTALMEIVLEPDIRGAEEAGAALRSLQLFLRRIGTCDGNMEDGSMRCDLNVSVRPAGEEGLGERVEVKNMNSVRHLMAAATGEARRQVELLEMGQGPIQRETRGFDEVQGETVRLRGKEGLVDYRFFPEPDLPPLLLTGAQIEAIKATLPELPQAKMARLSQEYGVAADVSRWLVCAPGGASDYFERLMNGGAPGGAGRDTRVAVNWVCNNLFRRAKDHLSSRDIICSPEDALERFFPTERLGELLDLLADGKISSQTAKSVFRIMVEDDRESTAATIVEARGLQQMTDLGEIEALCCGIIEDPQHSAQLAKYRAGNTNLSKFFMGQAFKATRGRADGKVVEECVMRLLEGAQGASTRTQ